MKKVPRYKGLRLFIVPVILYYLLVSPVLGMLFITNSPKAIQLKLIKERQHPGDSLKNGEGDLNNNQDSISIDSTGIHINIADGTVSDSLPEKGVKNHTAKNKGGYSRGEELFFNFFLVSMILGFIFSLPYKIYFRRKRKNLKIPERIELFCRKTVLYSPLIMAAIMALPFLVQNLNFINLHFISDPFQEEFQRKMSMQHWIIFFLSGLLTIAYVYFWQKHNVQILYMEHIFSKEELKKCIFKSKRGKIRNRLVFISFITTLLPLCIVAAYLLMSLTSLSDLGLDKPTEGEYKVIFGEYYSLIKDRDASDLINDFRFSYINVFNTFLLFIGIGAGILVTIFYLLSFVRWTNRGIINPIQELLYNMQKTTGGQLENYSMVRTNDEIGNLSENYNVMTSKLYEYISHIDKMNAELEQKVKDRTAEIQSQKEEIEAQRDEVESQRDEIERQRDYVIEQRDLIIQQKKAITDSIEYAANIQKAILPPIEEMSKVLQDYFIYYNPRDIVSGDFYWAHKIKKKGENQIIVVAADSTGHGVPGAFMSMLGITLLNEIIVKKGIYSPSEILDNLKENIVNSLHQTDEIGKSKDGIDLAVCHIDFEKKKLQYAGAYNPIYIVRQVKDGDNYSDKKSDMVKIDKIADKVVFEIKADKNPIGISHKLSKKYSLQEFDLKNDDVIYLFSDGYADQFGGNRRLKYLYSRFKILLAGISAQPMDMQRDSINNELIAWQGNEKQIDDILVIGVKIN